MPVHENGAIMEPIKHKEVSIEAMPAFEEFLDFVIECVRRGQDLKIEEMWVKFIDETESDLPPEALEKRLKIDVYAQALLEGMVPPRLRHLFINDNPHGEYDRKIREAMKS